MKGLGIFAALVLSVVNAAAQPPAVPAPVKHAKLRRLARKLDRAAKVTGEVALVAVALTAAAMASDGAAIRVN